MSTTGALVSPRAMGSPGVRRARPLSISMTGSVVDASARGVTTAAGPVPLELGRAAPAAGVEVGREATKATTATSAATTATVAGTSIERRLAGGDGSVMTLL